GRAGMRSRAGIGDVDGRREPACPLDAGGRHGGAHRAAGARGSAPGRSGRCDHRPVPQTGSRVQIDEDIRIDEDHRSSPRVMAMSRSLVSLRFHAAPLSRSTIARPLRRRSARTILTPSFSRRKATSSPTFQPNASLSSLGTVTCPFTVMVLVFMARVLLLRSYSVNLLPPRPRATRVQAGARSRSVSCRLKALPAAKPFNAA